MLTSTSRDQSATSSKPAQ